MSKTERKAVTRNGCINENKPIDRRALLDRRCRRNHREQERRKATDLDDPGNDDRCDGDTTGSDSDCFRDGSVAGKQDVTVFDLGEGVVCTQQDVFDNDHLVIGADLEFIETYEVDHHSLTKAESGKHGALDKISRSTGIGGHRSRTVFEADDIDAGILAHRDRPAGQISAGVIEQHGDMDSGARGAGTAGIEVEDVSGILGFGEPTNGQHRADEEESTDQLLVSHRRSPDLATTRSPSGMPDSVQWIDGYPVIIGLEEIPAVTERNSSLAWTLLSKRKTGQIDRL